MCAPVADRTNWTLARLAAEIAQREGVTISRSQLSKVLRKNGDSGSDGRGTRWKAGRSRAKSRASVCGSNCANSRRRRGISCCSTPTRARR
ncbi:winged helix-turn-helix domain-containing protein [Aurantimonas sp. C2-4-R8]|uniref:winged helix-turn-helix domain-containing protein n=1 Tax=Aurantimonas sp. C2-4-R8 TaxID=3114364 RepID=UPI003FA4C2B6